MKRMSLALILVLTACLFTPAPALSGQWMMIHGMGCAKFWGPTSDTLVFQGMDGLYFYKLPIPSTPGEQGQSGVAQFAVPSISGSSWAARHLKVIVNFTPFNNNLDVNNCAPAWVTQIVVWNGNELVKIFPGQWGGGYQEIALDLGSAVTFSKGLGIQIVVKGIGPKPVDAVGASIHIVGVGGEFSQTASSLPASNLLLND